VSGTTTRVLQARLCGHTEQVGCMTVYQGHTPGTPASSLSLSLSLSLSGLHAELQQLKDWWQFAAAVKVLRRRDQNPNLHQQPW
jgi:hypothetical protein